MSNKVVVIMGGWSHESDISLRSGAVVFDTLVKHEKRALIILKDRQVVLLDDLVSPNALDWRAQKSVSFLDAFKELKDWDCQVALLALHGKGGEDGVIQGFLETLQIPHTHSDVRGSAVSMDKEFSKYVYQCNQIPTPKYALISANDDIGAKLASSELEFPIVAKPLASGSSFGVYLLESLEDLKLKTQEFWGYDERFLLEEYIQGREFTCVVLDEKDAIQALPVTEIIPINSNFFDYEAKYLDNSTQEITPAEISDELSEAIQKLSLACHQALKCSGVTRTDFMLTADNQIFVLETNTIPGMTNGSILPKVAVAAGISFVKLLDKLIATAIKNG